jgi:pyruvate/2-oxoglutarate dehydrogenase complex dihydrolipoamide dehydrogenase (E3) component
VAESCDAIVIGTGQGGKPLAQALARAGRSVAIIERDLVGGSCVNVGCSPTKTMVASARVAYLARRAGDFGVFTGPIRVDQAVVRARKRDIAQSFSAGNRRGLDGTDGLELIMGEASFTSSRELDVRLKEGGTRSLEAELIVINAGLRPATPSISGLEDASYLDSTSVMELDVVPEHLLVLGGGYIGLEFGQMYRRFGARVTIVDRHARLMVREDEDVSDALAEILQGEGIELVFEAEAARLRSTAEGLELDVNRDAGVSTLAGSHLLLATGRRPNTENLGLDAAGVEVDSRGFIRVNDRLETNVAGLYAIGDVNGGPAFTHISYDDYRVLAANLLEGSELTTRGRPVPYTLFTDPQLGRVGITEAEAADRGLDVLVAKMPMTHVARALESDDARGFMKAIVDKETGRILGCAVLGMEGGELMSMLQIAMLGDLPYTALRDAIFAHPTLAESLNNLFARLEPPAQSDQ